MPRRPLDLNPEAPSPPPAKKRRGPKPKPPPQIGDPFAINATDYAPPKEVKVKRHSYDTQTIVNVLQFLYFHRILDRIPDARVGEKHPRYRSGTILQKEPDLIKGPEGSNMRYRSPTYEEAAAWFKIPKSTIGNWWNSRQELIKPESEVPRGPIHVMHGPENDPAKRLPVSQATVDQAQQPVHQTTAAQQVAIASFKQRNADFNHPAADQVSRPAVEETPGMAQNATGDEKEAPNPSEALALLQTVA